MRYRLIILIIALAAVLGLAACSSGGHSTSSSRKETASAKSSYDQEVQDAPAHQMNYSPTRHTINNWIDTWNVRGQLAFTYIVNQQGETVGYYVFEGPPVTMCAALTPTDHYEDPGGSNDNPNILRKSPSVDGVYYSGGQCSEYYGKDALTGRLIDFTAGGALNFITSTQPLNLKAPALGITTIEQVHPNAQGQYIKP